jgi:multiple sugar transport system permease protein
MRAASQRGATLGWRARRRIRRVAQEVLGHALLLASGITFLVPFLWLVSTSLKIDAQIFNFPPVWIPDPAVWSNYPRALTYIPFFSYLLNTLYISAFNVVGIVLSCPLVAYGLARIRWPGRDFLFVSVLATMMLPYQVTMIPLFIVFKWLGWVGSYTPLIVPAFFGAPFFIFLLRQFFMTIPFELSDAARIDGCSEFGIFRRIILPLAKPALATVALFTFVANWQDFLGPLIYLNDDTTFTLSLGLRQFLSEHSAEWALLMAASTVVIMPIIVLFFLTQRTFIQGISVTGLKD